MQFSLEYHNGIFEVKAKGDAEGKVFDDFMKAIINHKKKETRELSLD